MTKTHKSIKKIPLSVGVILIITLLILFFFQQNILVKQRDLLQIQTNKITSLSKTNEDLEMSFLEKNHLKNIEEIAKQLNFTKAEKIHYIKVLGGTVVAR